MVNNCPNINKTKNHPSPEIINTQKEYHDNFVGIVGSQVWFRTDTNIWQG
jgi:hypothetical protein